MNASTLDTLSKEIKAGKCILVIGPDIAKFSDHKSFFQYLLSNLRNSDVVKHLELEGNFVFEHDELFQLKGRGSNALYGFLSSFYPTIKEYNDIFAKIAQMPFKVIISLIPDKGMTKAFERIGLRYRYSYFSRTQGNKVNGIDKQDNNDPIIYNLMGDIDEYDAVLTFDDYFEYLNKILPEQAIPPDLSLALKDAMSFLFLGVHFEKWNMQLLLRKLLQININKENDKFTLLRVNNNLDSLTFVARRLDLNFQSEDPQIFVDELYNRLKTANNLKALPKKKVFLSYRHADKEYVEKIAIELIQHNIDLTFDKGLGAGESINAFMESIQNMDKVVVVLSKNSLRSAYVSHEINLTIHHNIHLIPCHLDDTFNNDRFGMEVDELIKSKLNEIDGNIYSKRIANHLADIPELELDRGDWENFGKNRASQSRFFKDNISVHIDINNFDQSINAILKAINK